MPSYYVVSATGGFVLAAQEPSTDQIISVINQAFPPSQSTWVGPSPRITREGTDTTLAATVFGAAIPRIHVTWVFSLPNDDPATAATVGTAMADALNQNLYGRWTASVSPFNQAVNGSLDWWSSGQAVASPTRDAPSTGSAPENPVGPTTPQTADCGALQRFNPFAPPCGGGSSPVDALTRFLTVAGIVAAGGAVLYLTWPLLSGLRTTASARQHARARAARANPSRRRARRSRRTRS